MRKGALVLLIVVLIILIGGYFVFNKPDGEVKMISDTSVSGVIDQDEVWSGNISVTGDVEVEKGVTLTILPGTIVTVSAFNDDQHKGNDHPHDPPFPKDPDRKETQSTVIQINGILNASGTADKKIVFTSDKKQTTYDWDGLYIAHGRLEYALVEYARYNNIQESSDVVISNSIFRNSLEDCLGIGHARPVSPQILNNEFYNCGHEGIDNAGGSAIIKGNYFHLENPEMQPDPSIGGNGIGVYQYSYPVIENNRFEKLRIAIFFLQDSRNEKEAGKKVMIRNNTIENNDIAFDFSPDYPVDDVIRKNNNLMNNKQEEVREQ